MATWTRLKMLRYSKACFGPGSDVHTVPAFLFWAKIPRCIPVHDAKVCFRDQDKNVQYAKAYLGQDSHVHTVHEIKLWGQGNILLVYLPGTYLFFFGSDEKCAAAVLIVHEVVSNSAKHQMYVLCTK